MKRLSILAKDPAFALLSRRAKCVGLALLMIATLTQGVLAQRGQAEPETASGVTDKSLAVAARHMISAANPYAAEAGREMLRLGGSALDAAIAAQLVLGLVEPQSSGLGGGAFILNWDQKAKSLSAYDGRETAPRSAKPDRFLKDGTPIKFETAVKSGLSIGTPGLVRLLEVTHKKHGKLAWSKLFEPAIRLADEGFEVSSRLSFLLNWNGPASFSPEAQAYFFDANGRARSAGRLLKNPEYARTLRAISAGGARAFYKGPIAESIVAAARGAPNFPSDLTLADLAGYRVRSRNPLCTPYRSKRICGMGPPSSGGIAVAQITALLAKHDLGATPADTLNPKAVHLIAEAEKLAYADRERYLADPDFVAVPDAGLLDPAYIDMRRSLIDPSQAMARPEPGNPPNARRRAFGIDATLERAGTSHISVIDGQGNAVSMTTTIEGAFGSGVWASGFLLNNELTDFSFLPADASGTAIANRVEAAKRPRSTMAPTIIFDEKGNVEAVLGSPGGSRIIYYVVKSLVALIDWKLDAQAAAALTNFGSQGGPLEVETAWRSVGLSLKMHRFGHAVRPDLLNSGIHIVTRRNGRLEGGADPRREGKALGD
jgi:gamma-glutamyltranspeptidase/glutathione hydrolase